MSMSESINELASALSLFQGEVKDAQKDKKGFSYNYADLSQVLEIARPLMAKHGLSLAQFPGSAGEKVTIESFLMHRSGQYISGTIEMPVTLGKGMSPAQAVGSVITYARRYATGAILGITQTDNDAAVDKSDQHKDQQKTLPSPQKVLESPRIDEKQLKHLQQVAEKERLDNYLIAQGLSDMSEIRVDQYQSIIDRLRIESMERKVA